MKLNLVANECVVVFGNEAAKLATFVAFGAAYAVDILSMAKQICLICLVE